MAPLFQVGVPSLQNRGCCWLSDGGISGQQETGKNQEPKIHWIRNQRYTSE